MGVTRIGTGEVTETTMAAKTHEVTGMDMGADAKWTPRRITMIGIVGAGGEAEADSLQLGGVGAW